MKKSHIPNVFTYEASFQIDNRFMRHQEMYKKSDSIIYLVMYFHCSNLNEKLSITILPECLRKYARKEYFFHHMTPTLHLLECYNSDWSDLLISRV